MALLLKHGVDPSAVTTAEAWGVPAGATAHAIAVLKGHESVATLLAPATPGVTPAGNLGKPLESMGTSI